MKKMSIILASLLFCAISIPSYGELQIDISNDKRIFTLFVLANTCGYDFENTSFSRPRNIVRMHIHGYDKKCGVIIGEFKKMTSGDPYYSRAMHDILSGTNDRQAVSRRTSIGELLIRYYECADLKQLEMKLKDEYAMLIEFYNSVSRKPLADALSKLKISEDDYPKKILIIPNPLDSHYRGYNVQTDDEYYIIVGAGRDFNNINTVIHELMHKYVDPVVFSRKDFGRRIESTFDEIRVRNEAIRNGYSNIGLYLDENIVIALEVFVASALFNKDPMRLLGDYRKEQYIYALPFLNFMNLPQYKNKTIGKVIEGFLDYNY